MTGFKFGSYATLPKPGGKIGLDFSEQEVVQRLLFFKYIYLRATPKWEYSIVLHTFGGGVVTTKKNRK